MKYQAYEEYKDSGVEMLGALPSTWCTKQVRYLLKDGAEGIKIGPFGSALKLDDMVDSGTRVYGQENVIKKDFTLGKRKISQSKFEEMKVYQAFTDDLLITMMGTSGKCELVPEDADVGIIDSHLLRLRVKESEILPRFFRLLIDECYEIENQIKISGKGSIMHGLNSSIVKSLTLPVPNPSEQRTILNFLDHETAKIDTLIEKQQQLIKLLKEKRQAVISHAVTKGLNTNAPMHDSGVEWLGEVPEHWNYGRLIYMCDCLVDGTHHSPESHFQGDYLYITAKNIKESGFDFSEITYITTEDHRQIFSRCSVQKGDVLYIKDGATAGIAMVNNLDDEFSLLSSVALIRPMKSKIISSFLAYHLNASQFKNNVLNQLVGGAMTRFTLDMISRLTLSLPPIDEQNKIVEFLDIKIAEFNIVIEKANKAINLMKERRTALISAAVTGKIDVRNWVAPERPCSRDISASLHSTSSQ